MGLFKKNPNESAYVGGRKHFTDVIKNSGPGGLLIWRQPEEDFNTNSTLVVMPGETAIFVNKGTIEQVFDIRKNYASLLPLNVEKEETFRGHLLMTFIATALLQQIQNELKNSNFSLDRILMRMRTQKAKVFENVVIPGEPVKEHRQIYKLLGVKCAKEYVRKAPTA